MSNNILTLMDQFFDDTFRPLSSSVTRALGTTAALNVMEYNDRYEIIVSIPGLDPNEVKVELVDNVLEVKYEHKSESEEKKDGQLLRQEFAYYNFSRRVALPKNVDKETIKAKSSRGVLTVVVNKIPETQPRKVEISVED